MHNNQLFEAQKLIRIIKTENSNNSSQKAQHSIMPSPLYFKLF